MSRPDVSRGLNLGDLDELSPAELVALRQFYLERVGFFHPAFDFWATHRPDVLKRYRMQSHAIGSSVVGMTGMLYYYASVGFEKGIYYEVRHCQNNGLSKDQILEVLALAFLNTGPRGAHSVALAVHEYLATFTDAAQPVTFPPGWELDPEAFRIELELSAAEPTEQEIGRILGWYERRCGEVPRHVAFLAAHHPQTLKQYHIRLSNAVGRHLPKQLVPLLLLQLSVARGHAAGIRENALLARGWGVTRDQCLFAVSYGLSFGEGTGLSIGAAAADELERIFDGWA